MIEGTVNYILEATWIQTQELVFPFKVPCMHGMLYEIPLLRCMKLGYCFKSRHGELIIIKLGDQPGKSFRFSSFSK